MTPALNETARLQLRNVLCFALADGEVTDEEKEFVNTLRQKLGFDREAFSEMVEDVRRSPKKYSVPTTPQSARQMLQLLAECAMSDDRVSDNERSLLVTIGQRVNMSEVIIDEILGQVAVDKTGIEDELQKTVDEMYEKFGDWDEPTRRAKMQALGDEGQAAVVPLLRLLESYRVPDGCDNALEFKRLAVEQLGRIGDSRAVYYLAQHVSFGDTDDEVNDKALRAACADAISKITGEGFPPDQEGIENARQWWLSRGSVEYTNLAI
ncbi:MAG: hypothetical protein ACLFV7_09175 [Phycisphaerae bacterium]